MLTMRRPVLSVAMAVIFRACFSAFSRSSARAVRAVASKKSNQNIPAEWRMRTSCDWQWRGLELYPKPAPAGKIEYAVFSHSRPCKPMPQNQPDRATVGSFYRFYLLDFVLETA